MAARVQWVPGRTSAPTKITPRRGYGRGCRKSSASRELPSRAELQKAGLFLSWSAALKPSERGASGGADGPSRPLLVIDSCGRGHVQDCIQALVREGFGFAVR